VELLPLASVPTIIVSVALAADDDPSIEKFLGIGWQICRYSLKL
jgi:hypothetical protein